MVTFLIIRFSSIGDIVLTTPIVRMLKKQVDGAKIIYLTKKKFASVLKENTYIDQLIVLEDSMKSVLEELKMLHIDYIIDLHHNLRSGTIKRKMGVPAFTVDKINFSKWFMVRFKINRLPKKHIVDRYLDTCRVFDMKDDGEGLDYFLHENDEVIPAAFHNELKEAYVGIVLGAMHFTKQIPLLLLKDICDQLNSPVLLLGGKDEICKGDELIGITKNKKVYNGCGKFSINQSASLVKQASVIVTADTGLMHIAAAFHRPILSIWGNTIPQFGMYPYKTVQQSAMFEVSGLKCRPCSKIGFDKCPKKHFNCMNLQDAKMIAGKANRILEGA